MKNLWPLIIVFGTIMIIGLVFLLGLGILRIQRTPMVWDNGGSNVWFDGDWDHHGMRWGVPMMGLFGGLLMLILPVGLLALTVVGVVLLVRALQQPNRDEPVYLAQHCSHCGKKVAPDWQVCPYCGESLKGD
jgi:hypothetical protein